MKIALTISDDAWSPIGPVQDPRARLTCSALTINGCAMHLEAYAVTTTEVGMQVSEVRHAEPEFTLEDEVDAVQTLVGTHAETTVITGRHYILAAIPHQG